jgi:hypothetical protein
MAAALTLSNPHIVSIPVADPTLAVYALYDGSPSAPTRPERLVILNMDFLESSVEDRIAPRALIDVSHLLGERTKIKRLSGPGSDATSGATFAGQSYDLGRPTGRKVVEKSGGIVVVRSSEAILVERY